MLNEENLIELDVLVTLVIFWSIQVLHFLVFSYTKVYVLVLYGFVDRLCKCFLRLEEDLVLYFEVFLLNI